MFDVGLWELVLCAIVALLVLGPERMPIAVRAIAKWLHAASTTLRALRREFEKELELDALKASLQPEPSRPAAPQVIPSPDVSAAIEALKAAVHKPMSIRERHRRNQPRTRKRRNCRYR